MNKIIIFSLLIFASLTCRAEGEEISILVENLNTQAVNELGVSIRSISFLIEYANKQYSPDYLKAIGVSDQIDRLVNAGYATVENMPAIPELPEQKFSKLIPTNKGNQMINALK